MKYLIKTAGCLGRVCARNRSQRAMLLAAIIASCGCEAQVSDPPNVGLFNAHSAAFNPAMHKGYVVDLAAGGVDVTDDMTGVTHTVKTGAGPVSIAVNDANGRAYVLNAEDGTVSVLDGKTDAVLATVKVGDHPYSIAADAKAGRICVTRTYNSNLMIIDATTNAVTSVKAGSPDLVAVDPQANLVYLLGYEGGELKTLDEASHALTAMTVGMHGWGMALNETTGTLYVARPNNAEVVVKERGSSTLKHIATGHIPCAITVNPRTNMIYVTNYGDDSVTVIDAAKGTATATIATGKRPEALAVDAEHSRIFVANTQGNSITVIDGATNRVIATLDAGPAPYALAVDAQAGKVHVANAGAKASTVVDVSRLNH